ncbi:hypothetical protein M409DRAFT_29074 [Zasmidium cellare ATCC 36951]|uniref:Pal1-domain-containing protein n=1 Tax=Zasmidium cellare ATCC 36951 TaxID=1080233 RepID=A0A6A6C3J9_ZASCE|nr:uncharacterized protein M409DRAFT_29074 [Zasmidium cellare ATCC 36951]KAF2160452.1 hypothetical protein M409DRAFT_29074 [Zasmidium cellare ATCC 36951]
MAFAAAPTGAPDRQRSPVGLTLNLSSNNPFRNRTTSPSPRNSPFLESPAKPPRPVSTNPFLDDSEMTFGPTNPRANNNTTALPEDLFNELSLLERPVSNGATTTSNGGPHRAGTLPPQANRPQGPDPRRAPPRPPRGPPSPVKREFNPPPQKQRRASESSVMEKDRRPRVERDRGERPERTESEERRRRERRREREERHRREKEKVRNGEKRPRKPQGLDIIDKLDVTGIYGQGLFHHDGPFDACNPHRNVRKDRKAPMQAFPADSANMQLGGAGPLRSRLDLDKFHGRGEEGFSEYAATRKADTNIVDPLQRAEPVHGEETYGLGTSTFLEGAPASKNALQRRDSEDPALGNGVGGGLSRKKSLAQRFRGMSNSRRNGPPDYRSPEARYADDLESPQAQIKSVSAGGPVQAKYRKEDEINPFDNDYEAAFEKKGTQIRIAEQEKPYPGRARAPSNPQQGVALTRSRTSDGNVPTHGRGSSNEEDRPSGSGGGFLNRMRSLKGGPRRKNDA